MQSCSKPSQQSGCSSTVLVYRKSVSRISNMNECMVGTSNRSSLGNESMGVDTYHDRRKLCSSCPRLHRMADNIAGRISIRLGTCQIRVGS